MFEKCFMCDNEGVMRSDLRSKMCCCDTHYQLLKQAEYRSDLYFTVSSRVKKKNKKISKTYKQV